MENNNCIKCGKYLEEIDGWCWICYLKNGRELKEVNKKNEKN